jgi:hypothetical protein
VKEGMKGVEEVRMMKMNGPNHWKNCLSSPRRTRRFSWLSSQLPLRGTKYQLGKICGRRFLFIRSPVGSSSSIT